MWLIVVLSEAVTFNLVLIVVLPFVGLFLFLQTRLILSVEYVNVYRGLTIKQ